MVKAGFSESPDGAITSFTLDTTPATGGLVLIIHNGLILDVVGGTPGVGECTVTGTAIEVGLAPNSGDGFWAFVQDNILTSLRRTELTGDIDNSNQTFTIKAKPSSTNALIFFNGLACEEVASGPGANEITYTTGTDTDSISFWTAPFRTDRIEAFLPVPTDTNTATLAFTGSQDGTNAAYTLTKTGQISGDKPRLLTTLNGQLFDERTDYLAAATEYISDDTGDVITLGMNPIASDHINFYLLGAQEESWSTLIERTQRLIDDEDGLFHTETQVRVFLEQAELFVTIYRALGEETGDLSITSGTATYKIHNTFSDFIAPLRVAINNVALQESHIAHLQALDANWNSTTGTPEFYYMIGGTIMGFYPVPNASFTAKVTRLKVPDGATDKYAPPSVDPVWHNLLPLYAASLALISEGKISERVQGLMQQFMEAIGLRRDRRFMPGPVQKEVASHKIVDQRRSGND